MSKIKELLVKMNEGGIRLPLLKDHDKGRGSYTLTMFVASWIVGVVLLSGKALKYFGEVDYSNVLMLIGIMGAFYTGKDFYSMVNGKKVGIGNGPNDSGKSSGAEPPV